MFCALIYMQSIDIQASASMADFPVVLLHSVCVVVAGLSPPAVLSCCIWFQG